MALRQAMTLPSCKQVPCCLHWSRWPSLWTSPWPLWAEPVWGSPGTSGKSRYLLLAAYPSPPKSWRGRLPPRTSSVTVSPSQWRSVGRQFGYWVKRSNHKRYSLSDFYSPQVYTKAKPTELSFYRPLPVTPAATLNIQDFPSKNTQLLCILTSKSRLHSMIIWARPWVAARFSLRSFWSGLPVAYFFCIALWGRERMTLGHARGW